MKQLLRDQLLASLNKSVGPELAARHATGLVVERDEDQLTVCFPHIAESMKETRRIFKSACDSFFHSPEGENIFDVGKFQVDWKFGADLSCDHEAEGTIIGDRLLEGSRLSAFVETASNRDALTRLSRLRTSGASEDSVLYYLYGQTGVGKTHLAQAVAREALEAGLRVGYFSFNGFQHRFVRESRENQTSSFRAEMRDLALLVIDELQSHSGFGSGTMREFVRLVVERCNNGLATVLCSIKPLSATLAGCDQPAFCSRMQASVILKINPYDPDEIEAILTPEIQRGARWDEDALQTLVRRGTSDIRVLKGQVAQLNDRHERVTAPLVDQFLTEREGPARQVSIADIQQVVARAHSLTVSDLKRQSRARAITWPRHIAMFLAKRMTNKSLPQIGRYFGNMDHTSVIYAVRRVDSRCLEDATVKAEILNLHDEVLRSVRTGD